MVAKDHKFKEFKDLYNYLKYKYSCYKPSIISYPYNIPNNLQNNIDNYGEYIDLFEKLVKSKLFIWCKKGYNHDKMFYNYILPTSVFLHYMHVNLDNITEINLFIVNHKTYQRYNLDIGGEYTTGYNSIKDQRSHMILVKDYSDLHLDNSDLIDVSLTSLFHELMHLVDNIGFINDPNPYCIEYELRCHEIKARILSQFFYGFYRGLNDSMKLKNRMWVLNRWIRDLNDSLMGIYETIQSILFCNNEIITLETTGALNTLRNTTYIMNTSKQNIQYYHSLRQINKLNKFFKDFNEVSRKL